MLFNSTVRELPGKSPKNFRGSSGNFRGSLGNFPEARGSLTPSQRLAKFVSKVRVYRGTGVSRGVRRTTWERSLKNWELQISCFEEFLGGGTVLGLFLASPPHTLGYACTFTPPLPLPQQPFHTPTTLPPTFTRVLKKLWL